ncbi:hypothetical protein [Streptomyces sp. NPDC002889]|uniref:hypothetical protein n=1 Tax=Streptomyces sp. NPDC002889 TaxID=3364669 RepID=UPI0036AD62A8
MITAVIDDKVYMAARNNAQWCDAMCRAHGLPGSFGARVWTNGRRTPPLYPDAVTLTGDATADDILGTVDTAGPGCSVKDSFVSLDLAAAGFEVLFEAQWLHRPGDLPAPVPPPGREWERVRSPAELAAWAAAWDGDEGLAGLFRPELLTDPATTFLAAREAPGKDRIVAGAVVSLGAGAAGISNLFAVDDDLDAAWAGALAAVARRWPGTPVVGYEQGDDLTAAVGQGCAPVGPLRVWLVSAQAADEE